MHIKIRLESQIHEAAAKAAEAEGLSLGDYIRGLVQKGVQGDPKSRVNGSDAAQEKKSGDE
jgi:hypothetical protein